MLYNTLFKFPTTNYYNWITTPLLNTYCLPPLSTTPLLNTYCLPPLLTKPLLNNYCLPPLLFNYEAQKNGTPIDKKTDKQTLSDTNQSSQSSVGGSTKETALTIYQKCRKNADKRGLTLEFFEKLVKVCNNIQCDPMDMLAKMWASSRWKTYAVNEESGAVGLTQIKPEILRKYGVNPENYQKMSAVEQLDIIEKYFLRNKKKCNMDGKYLTGEDLFAMNFLSSRANQEVLVKSRSDRYYDEKRDKDGDGDIDKADMRVVLNLKKKEMLA